MPVKEKALFQYADKIFISPPLTPRLRVSVALSMFSPINDTINHLSRAITAPVLTTRGRRGRLIRVQTRDTLRKVHLVHMKSVRGRQDKLRLMILAH